MLKRLTLKNFKSFQDATIEFDRFSVLVGANASGKSNIVEALRFLNGIGREYSLAEIIGGKYVGGDLQWQGIRGGPRGISFLKRELFEIASVFYTEIENGTESSQPIIFNHEMGIRFDPKYRSPFLENERLAIDESCPPIQGYQYHDSGVFYKETVLTDLQNLTQDMEIARQFKIFMSNGRVLESKSFNGNSLLAIVSSFSNFFWESQSLESDHYPELGAIVAEQATSSMKGIYMIDFRPDVMREPSPPWQDMLGDRGENLSSVLQSICNDPQRKERLLSWLQELTPMDAVDIEFREDLSGKILLELVEGNGQRTLAFSASDGTLRFLGLLAALLNPRNASSPHLYIFEELENGIHPTRLHLVMQLISEEIARNPNLQVIATTHSPLLLHFLDKDYWDGASLVYRLPGQPDSRIAKIMDIPNARKIIEEQDFARLHESGWLENAMYFLADDEE